MSWHLLSEVYKRKIGSAPRKAVLAYCADKANDDGTGIFASKATIAKATELGRSTVIRVFSELVDEGVLVPVGHRKCANGATVDYTLVGSKLTDFPALNDDENTGKGSQSGTSPDRDPSQSGTPPVPERDPKTSQSGTQTTLEPPLNDNTPVIPNPLSLQNLFDGHPGEPPEEKVPRSQPKSSKARLPENWTPSLTAIEYAQAKGLHQNEIEELANDFRDYWTDRTDSRARKSERGWEQAWRNRIADRLATILRNREMVNRSQSGGRGQGSGIASAAARRAGLC